MVRKGIVVVARFLDRWHVKQEVTVESELEIIKTTESGELEFKKGQEVELEWSEYEQDWYIVTDGMW